MKKIVLSLAVATGLLQAEVDMQALTPLDEIVSGTSGSVLEKFSFGGYGKMDYTNYVDNDSKTNTLDIYRYILYVGYAFTENIKFASELEWEHGGREETGGYGIVEQAYIDFKLNDTHNIKVGHMIVPVGMVNLYHEPTAFDSVARPEIEKYIVPSTWHENGAVAYGNFADFSYQAGIMAGLNAEGAKDIRSMRQNGQKSRAEDFAFVARVDYNGFPGLNIGGSLFRGDAGQGIEGLENVSTMIAEAHINYNYRGVKLKGMYAVSKVENAEDIVTQSENSTSIAANAEGYYLNASYTMGEWRPFVQYEAYNDKKEYFDTTGSRADVDDEITNLTLGINYNPTDNVVLKADYMIRDNRGADDDRFALGIGYAF